VFKLFIKFQSLIIHFKKHAKNKRMEIEKEAKPQEKVFKPIDEHDDIKAFMDDVAK